jgi:hypothetical protein
MIDRLWPRARRPTTSSEFKRPKLTSDRRGGKSTKQQQRQRTVKQR